jgi:hypothetical protein
MIPQITGQIAPNEPWRVGSIPERLGAMREFSQPYGDPRGQELLSIIGSVTSPLYYGEFFDPIQNWGTWAPLGIWWIYFEAGMLVASSSIGKGTCAKVLYGPILDFYAKVDQFAGPLSVPMTDVQTLPDGTSFAVFKGGLVLYLDQTGTVQILKPIPPSMFRANSGGIDPSPAGITAFAQQTVQAMANKALQTNSQLKDNVQSINATITSMMTVDQEFMKSSPKLAWYDVNLPRMYVFGVHFDIQLSGCAGTFGGATADFSAEAWFQLQPLGSVVPNRIVGGAGGTGDPVGASSPFGQADDQIKLGITHALENAGTLLNKPLPTGSPVLALLVAPDGTANLYIEPICATTSLFQATKVRDEHAVLRRIRELRDSYLMRTVEGQTVAQLATVMGPTLLDAIRRERHGRDIVRSMGVFLERAFNEDANVERRSRELVMVSKHLEHLVTVLQVSGSPEETERLTSVAIRFVRDNIKPGRSFEEVMRRLDSAIVDELARLAPLLPKSDPAFIDEVAKVLKAWRPPNTRVRRRKPTRKRPPGAKH